MIPTLLLLGFLPLLAAGSETAPKPPPFSVTMNYRTGTVPPPYFYSFAVSIGEKNGEVVLAQGYEGNPKWRETFKVTPADRQRLHETFTRHQLCARKWQRVDPQPVGGGLRSLRLSMGGRTCELTDDVVESQKDAAKAIFDAVQNSVPEDAWQKIHAARDDWAKRKP